VWTVTCKWVTYMFVLVIDRKLRIWNSLYREVLFCNFIGDQKGQNSSLMIGSGSGNFFQNGRQDFQKSNFKRNGQ